MTVNNKPNGKRQLTIVDPPDNSDEVHADLNEAAEAAEGDAERKDVGNANIGNTNSEDDGDAPSCFQSNNFDESIVLGLMGMVDMNDPSKSLNDVHVCVI
jgi:hypothetical protein